MKCLFLFIIICVLIVFFVVVGFMVGEFYE